MYMLEQGKGWHRAAPGRVLGGTLIIRPSGSGLCGSVPLALSTCPLGSGSWVKLSSTFEANVWYWLPVGLWCPGRGSVHSWCWMAWGVIKSLWGAFYVGMEMVSGLRGLNRTGTDLASKQEIQPQLGSKRHSEASRSAQV